MDGSPKAVQDREIFKEMRYYIIAGEASGDLHGSNLMRGIYANDPGAVIRFWGGDLMARVYMENAEDALRTDSDGVTTGSDVCGKDNRPGTGTCRVGGLVRHYRDGAVMGFTEVLAKAGKLLRNVSDCKRDITGFAPDCVILIDYPGFNFKIAGFAHEKGLKVFYYIAPKVWASREGRIRKLKKYVDRLYIIFPFEIPYFERKGVPFVYRGNPLIDAVDSSRAMNESRGDFLSRCSLPDRPMIAMLAGSRKSEISTMTPVLTVFAEKMHSLPQYAEYQFIIAGAPGRSPEDYLPYLKDQDYVSLVFGETQSIVRQSEAAVVNSGTASLETVLLGTPQVVGFIMGSRLTYAIAKRIVKVKYISLGNLCVNRFAFKEFIQDECNPDALVAEVRRLIEDAEYRRSMLDSYAEIRRMLGGSGASSAVAEDMIASLRPLPENGGADTHDRGSH